MRSVSITDLYAMTHGLDIEKRHGRRFEIIQKKSCQHQDYRKGGISKYEIGKDGISKYKYLAIFLKSCQCCNIGS